MKKHILTAFAMGAVACGGQAVSHAADGSLGAQLSNPVAALTQVPIEYDFDQGYDKPLGFTGPGDSNRHYLNVEPVIPFELSPELALVTRTIVPVVADQPFGDLSGFGDTFQAFYFVPSPMPTDYGTFTIGVGPAITWPTSSQGLGTGIWGAGLSGVALIQRPIDSLPEGTSLTMGILASHQWGVGTTRDQFDDASAYDFTQFEPFVAIAWPENWTTSVTIEGGYDWAGDNMSLPLNLQVSKVVSVGGQLVQLKLGARYWLDSPEGSAEDWGLRAGLTFLFPKAQ